MENILYNISQVLGITIIHSLWQGLMVWVFLRAIFVAAPNLQAVKKYNITAAAMLVLFAWFMVTLFNEAGNLNWTPVNESKALGFTPVNIPNKLVQVKLQADRFYYAVEAYLPHISILYIIGLLVNLFKLSYCRVKLYQIKKALLPSGELQWKADEFSQLLGITRYVQVSFSRLIDVPCMIGYLKPVILLPVSLAAGLSVPEVEAILLHELAHIKRNDYIINLLQQIVTSLLFFNPFAQLIGRLIYTARENCCDDRVVQITNNPLVYAHALLKLEESRQNNLQLALAASTQKHYLLNRIERIMKTKKTNGNMRHLLVAVILLAGSLGSIAWLNPEIKNGRITVKKVGPAEVMHRLFADTGRKKAVKLNAVTPKTITKNKTTKYNWNNDNDFNDPELERLSAEVQKHADVVSNYYKEPEFNKQIELITQKSKAIEDYYNRPDIRKLHDEQELIGKSFEKNLPEVETLNKQIRESGDRMSKYYDGPEFADLVARMEKKYNIPHKRYLVSRDSADWGDNYKKFQKAITTNIPEEVRLNQKKITELSKKISGMYNTAEFKQLSRKMTALNDSMIAANANANIKQQQIELGLISAKMSALQNNPQMKREQKLLLEASKRLKAYTNTPEFKAKEKEWKKNRQAYRVLTLEQINSTQDSVAEKVRSEIQEVSKKAAQQAEKAKEEQPASEIKEVPVKP